VAIAIFSAYILYDVQQIVNGGETNYIRATLALYLDVYNIFTSLLPCWASSAAIATKRHLPYPKAGLAPAFYCGLAPCTWKRVVAMGVALTSISAAWCWPGGRQA
jgi:hypothetical protein